MQTPLATRTQALWFIPGFLLLAFGSLGYLLVELMISSNPVAMAPGAYRLLASAWGASVVFAAAYHFAPIMASTPLWSPPSGWLHLALHSAGLGLLIRGQFSGEVAATGSVLMGCGAGLFALNFTITAGIKSRWSPANLLFTTSLLWLAVELVASTQLAVQPKPRGLVRSPEWTARLMESALVIGFLWQATMAIALEALKKAACPSRGSEVMAWIGFGALNLGLAAIFWLPQAVWAGAVQSTLLVTGLFMLVLALATAISAAGSKASSVAGFSIGLAASAVLLAACWPFQVPAGNAMSAVLHLLGVSWICLAARLIPLTIGRRGTGILLAEHRMPSLVFGGTISSLLLGAGALLGAADGMSVGASLLLATIIWWFITVSPAWCRFRSLSTSVVARTVEP